MATVFVDLTGEESHWNGETGATIADNDGLTGHDHALRLRNDVEIVLTTPQLITLYDTLDAWVHGGPIKETGAVRGRVQKALVECLTDNNLKITNKSGDFRTHEGFAHMLEEYMRMNGVRFRITGDEEREGFLARRARRAAAMNDPRNPAPPQPEAPTG